MNKLDIQHITSSPRFPQSNGEAERAVRTVKTLMNKSLDLYAALCMYRDTPLDNGYSPAQLLFNRPLNSMGIMSENRIDLNRLRKFEEDKRQKQKIWYDKRYATQNRQPLALSQQVVVKDPGKHPIKATYVGTRSRETVAINEKDNLIRRIRALLTNRCTDDRQEQNTQNHQFENSQKQSSHKTGILR